MGTDATGTCTVSTLPTCTGPTTGLAGSNICKVSGVSYGDCCPNPTTGNTNNNCFAVTDSSDSFCMAFSIPEGSSCGTTSAETYAGFCAAGLNCIGGVCSSATTAAAPATACAYSGEKCWDGTAVTPASGVSGCC